jgi:hypothetical protein
MAAGVLHSVHDSAMQQAALAWHRAVHHVSYSACAARVGPCYLRVLCALSLHYALCLLTQRITSNLVPVVREWCCNGETLGVH